LSRILSAVVALAIAQAIIACADGETILCEGEVVNNTCVPWVVEDTPVLDQTVGTPDTTGVGPDIVSAPDVEEETCLPAVDGVFPIGSACSKNCECSTGYCYDEAYLGDFRFCSKPCSEGCSEENVTGFQEHTCLVLGGSLAVEHGLVETSICMRVCETVEDCKALSSSYDKCGETLTKETKWSGSLIAAVRTCQIAAEVN